MAVARNLDVYGRSRLLVKVTNNLDASVANNLASDRYAAYIEYDRPLTGDCQNWGREINRVGWREFGDVGGYAATKSASSSSALNRNCRLALGSEIT